MRAWLGVPLDIPVVLGREEAQRRALEELAKAKYGGRPGWVDDALARVFRFLERLYGVYLRVVEAQQGSGGGINWGFVLAVVVLLVALALVIWKVGLPKWRRGKSEGSLELDANTPAADYRAQAVEHARVGDWPGAVRDLFRAIVRELETRTILDVRPARTAWEAASSAGRVMPAARDALFAGADLFSRVLYGHQPADADSYAQMMRIDAVVTKAADQVDFSASALVSRP